MLPAVITRKEVSVMNSGFIKFVVDYINRKIADAEAARAREQEAMQARITAQNSTAVRALLKPHVEAILNQNIYFPDHNTISLQSRFDKQEWQIIANAMVERGNVNIESARVVASLNDTVMEYFYKLNIEFQNSKAKLDAYALEVGTSPLPPHIEAAYRNLFSRYEILNHRLAFTSIQREGDSAFVRIRITIQ